MVSPKQWEALKRCAKDSLGYVLVNASFRWRNRQFFQVNIYWLDQWDHEQLVGFVSRSTAQYWDGQEKTRDVIERVSRRVFHRSVNWTYPEHRQQ